MGCDTFRFFIFQLNLKARNMYLYKDIKIVIYS